MLTLRRKEKLGERKKTELGRRKETRT